MVIIDGQAFPLFPEAAEQQEAAAEQEVEAEEVTTSYFSLVLLILTRINAHCT